MYIGFQNPVYLYFLLITPIIALVHFFNFKFLKKESLKFANFEAIQRVKGVEIYSRNIYAIFVNVLIFVLIIFFISGITLYRDVDSSLFTFVIAIDSSQSMEAIDIDPNRFEAAKEISIDFINSLPGESNIGIVSFSGNTYVENKVTSDKEELEETINTMKIRDIGGTDVFEAISISLNLLEDEENKAVILISDGQVNVGDINGIIQLARESRVIVNTIGIGTSEGGQASFGISKIDEQTLRDLSVNTDGVFFKAGTNEEIENAFREMAPLSKGTSALDLSSYLAILIVVLFVFEPVISRREKIV